MRRKRRTMRKDKVALPDRRRFLKELIGVPVLAALGGGIACRREPWTDASAGIADLDALAPPLATLNGQPLRVGVVGLGRRGQTLLKHCLYDDLNVTVTGICDVFDVHADAALALVRQSGGRPRRFRTYYELVQSPEVDVVIIATPDHWHAPMALSAAESGKPMYVERCLGQGLAETVELYDAVKRAAVVLQLGHQHRQTERFLAAKGVMRRNLLGHVGLVQATTRAAQDGAWQAPLHPEANARTIDWRQFLGNAPAAFFEAERFFRWRRWWAYGHGLAGESLTQDFDRLNGVLGLGIPSAVVASGGIYTHRDGREVPDVFHVTMEFPEYRTAQRREQGLTVVYSAALGEDHERRASLAGRGATLQWDRNLVLETNAQNALYRPSRRDGVVLYAPRPTLANAAADSESGEQHTWRHGVLYDATYLHLREWLGCVRHGGTPSCDIEQAFEEAVTAHMATLAYRLGRRVEWDAEKRKPGNVTRGELASLRMA